MDTSNVTLVTVTYGKRFNLLLQVLKSAFAQGVANAVVVNNGSQDLDHAGLESTYGDKVTIIDIGRNSGSAMGFGSGLKAAMAHGAQRILILDDDNVLEAGALKTLQTAYDQHVSLVEKDRLIVLGHRPSQLKEEEQSSVGYLSGMQQPNSFFGFQVKDIPMKLLQRSIFSGLLNSTHKTKTDIRLATAPYSGMFFDKSLVERNGYPREDFVLYADDTEYSYRVSKAGGSIFLILNACIRDIEASWNVRKRHSSIFHGFLNGAGDLRAYYAARNQSYYESHCRVHNKTIRSFNKFVFMCLLRFFAIKGGDATMKRYKLLVTAIEDGEHERLGINPAYPLG